MFLIELTFSVPHTHLEYLLLINKKSCDTNILHETLNFGRSLWITK